MNKKTYYCGDCQCTFTIEIQNNGQEVGWACCANCGKNHLTEQETSNNSPAKNHAGENWRDGE